MIKTVDEMMAIREYVPELEISKEHAQYYVENPDRWEWLQQDAPSEPQGLLLLRDLGSIVGTDNLSEKIDLIILWNDVCFMDFDTEYKELCIKLSYDVKGLYDE